MQIKNQVIFALDFHTEPAADAASAKTALSEAKKVESIDYGHGQALPVGRELQGEEYLQEVVADATSGATKRGAMGRDDAIGRKHEMTEGDRMYRENREKSKSFEVFVVYSSSLIILVCCGIKAP